MVAFYGAQGENGERYYVETEDVHFDPLGIIGTSVGQGGVANFSRKSYVYRKMCEAEFDIVKQTGKMPGLQGKNATTGEKWVTESLEHSRGFDNKAGRNRGQHVVTEFQMDRQGYQGMRDAAIPQQGSRARQPREGTQFNLLTDERLQNHPRGKMNLGLKGQANINKFNDHVISVKRVNPDAIMNKSVALRWLRRNKWTAAAGAIGVVLDATSVVLSVIEDGHRFGAQTTVTVSEIAGGAAGAAAAVSIGSTIGSALGTVIPGIGNIVLGFLGMLIGSLISGGITSFFLSLNPTAPGRGPPIMDTDPTPTLYGQPSGGYHTGATGGQPSGGYHTGIYGAPSSGLRTGAMGHPNPGWAVRK